jgi:chorismate synthase
MLIKNKDWENWQKDMALFGEATESRAVTRPRPGHADLTGMLKYGFSEARPVLERASARETATRVAAGAVAVALLRATGVRLGSHVRAIGAASLAAGREVSLAEAEEKALFSDVSCVDEKTAAAMRQAIDEAKASGDTLGGVVEVIVEGLPPGLGSYVQWDRRLDGRLAAAVMSIPAFKAVEIGEGCAVAGAPGSLAHDEIFPGNNGVRRGSNRAGGLEGGMTNGERLLVRGYMKPIPTLMQPLSSIDVRTGKASVAAAERSDTTAVPAAAVVAEAMVAWVLAGELVEKFAADNMADLLQSLTAYLDGLKKGGYAPCTQ